MDFIDLTNLKAVVEMRLRHFACRSTGDMVTINYDDKIFELSARGTKHANAVSIIEYGMNIDFAPPVGYVEPDYKAQAPKTKEEDKVNGTDFQVFQG